MIFVSIGIDGNTIKEDIDLRDLFRGGGGYYSSYGGGSSIQDGLIPGLITEIRGTENQVIKKAIDLAKNSSTPDNAAKKIRKIVEAYTECTSLYHERLGRMQSGEPLKDVIREYFFSDKGQKGYLPVKPVAMCNTYTWDHLRKLKIPSFSNYPNVPRILGVEIIRDMGIGEARLFSMEVTMGFSNEKSAQIEQFTEVNKHIVNLTMERVEKE